MNIRKRKRLIQKRGTIPNSNSREDDKVRVQGKKNSEQAVPILHYGRMKNEPDSSFKVL